MGVATVIAVVAVVAGGIKAYQRRNSGARVERSTRCFKSC